MYDNSLIGTDVEFFLKSVLIIPFYTSSNSFWVVWVFILNMVLKVYRVPCILKIKYEDK